MFLIPLLLGFVLDWASAFTAVYSYRLGARRGQLASAVLRNVLGIPLWILGLVLAVRTPAPTLLAPNAVANAMGWLLIATGSLLVTWALASLGLRAAAPSARDALVRRGPYAHVRHPIYDGVLCQFGGSALLRPTWPIVLSCLLGVGWAIVQARTRIPRLCQPGAPLHPPVAEGVTLLAGGKQLQKAFSTPLDSAPPWCYTGTGVRRRTCANSVPNTVRAKSGTS
jgi:protein-S-isoprenylcysteine O-methyltransferase Ste14